MTFWIAAFVALALGGVMKGATGAGAPILAVPVIALLSGDVAFAVSLLVLPNLLSNTWQGWTHRRDVLPPGFTAAFAVAGLVGAGIGTVLLAELSADYLILATAVAVYAYVVFRLSRPDWVLPMHQARRVAWPAGVLGGVLQGAVGLSAPVSISFLNALRLPRRTFVGTISVFFFTMTVVQIPLLAGYGILTWHRALLSLLALIPILGAMPIGAWLASRISPAVFDRVILIFLVLIATRLSWGVFFGPSGL